MSLRTTLCVRIYEWTVTDLPWLGHGCVWGSANLHSRPICQDGSIHRVITRGDTWGVCRGEGCQGWRSPSWEGAGACACVCSPGRLGCSQEHLDMLG